jgi:hypothetical protein
VEGFRQLPGVKGTLRVVTHYQDTMHVH